MTQTNDFYYKVHFSHDCWTENTTEAGLRGHVLYDAVEKVESLVVIGLGGNKLLENSK